MGIDMSRAFDTIKRHTIIALLQNAGCSRDDIRLVQYLLSNTTLRVQVGNCTSDPFPVLIGAFQGDALSGKLFTLVFAGALHHLRAVSVRPNPPISILGAPLESEYADDGDFLDDNRESLDILLPLAKDILQQWNLFVNEDKTEFVRVYLADKSDVNEKGESLVNNEPWRSNKLLGSLLCSTKDITRRCILGNAAFSTFKKIWLQGAKISLERKLKVYEAQVVSVMLYNCNSWSAPQNVINKLDITHRRHLRSILNIHWPTGRISNKALYKRCKCSPLSDRVTAARWKMLGHILRSGETTPAYTSLHFALKGAQQYKGRVGRPRSNLFDIIVKDLAQRQINFKNIDDLFYITDLAQNRVLWNKLY